MADCAGDGVVGGELGELELAEIALAEDQLAVRKQELALRQRKLAVPRQRKGGSSAAAGLGIRRAWRTWWPRAASNRAPGARQHKGG